MDSYHTDNQSRADLMLNAPGNGGRSSFCVVNITAVNVTAVNVTEKREPLS